ncbi:N-acetylmuramoyl-L-alanine amidase [Alsobacter metallidurans]|uniref:N-acetylmuramoyl-L-alanine amidase n=1 Tax=Alsobacter metallidurans TaxID=340221 RepID=A0A917IA70_9HYPH|nr:N-acetylmuramoyl-L-alanine amidase [Alsobacter metallidurans]GGH27545.1 N-acetylmuramoyl-L-alanine amidase [Alsobacter metallidurans]
MSLLTPDSPLAQKVVPSPNQGERKGGRRPDILLVHYTGMRDAASALARLADPLAEVSCHYVVLENGRILQMVPEAARAWHAGASVWAGETDINSASIGIELVNPGHDGGYPDFPDAQVEATIRLGLDITSRWRIPAHRVLAHSDVSPGRKVDPGEKFPWESLHAAGLGHWTSPAPLGDGRSFGPGEEGQPIQALQAMLAMYGYGLDISGVFDPRTEAVVAAFQRHFRPALVDGVADASTITTLRDLIRSRPEPAA